MRLEVNKVGRVSLPREVVAALGLRPHDFAEVVVRDDGVVELRAVERGPHMGALMGVFSNMTSVRATEAQLQRARKLAWERERG